MFWKFQNTLAVSERSGGFRIVWWFQNVLVFSNVLAVFGIFWWFRNVLVVQECSDGRLYFYTPPTLALAHEPRSHDTPVHRIETTRKRTRT